MKSFFQVGQAETKKTNLGLKKLKILVCLEDTSSGRLRFDYVHACIYITDSPLVQ